MHNWFFEGREFSPVATSKKNNSIIQKSKQDTYGTVLEIDRHFKMVFGHVGGGPSEDYLNGTRESFEHN